MIELMEFAAGWAGKGAIDIDIQPMEGSFLVLSLIKKNQRHMRFVLRPDTPPETVNGVVLKWLEVA